MKRPLIVVGVLVAVIAAVLLVRSRGGGKSASKPGPAVVEPGKGAVAGAKPSGGADRGGGGRGEQPVLIDDDPVGKLRLEGQVIDASDDPVGGATVVLSSNPPRTTTTEGDGSFAFEGLVGRSYQLVARAPAGIAGPLTTRLTGTKVDPVILKLRAAASVTVEVVDDKGAPVDGATVELRGLDTQTGTTTGGKLTLATVVPGGYMIAAWAPGFARAYQFVAVGGAAVTTRLALRRGASVAGRVVDDAGAPVVGARVIYFGASDWNVQPDERLDGQVTGADGKFRFEAVAAGSVRFEARHSDHAPGSSAIVTLDGTTEVRDVEIVMPSGATVSGTVIDGAGSPVPAARVRIGVAGAGFVSDGPRQAFADDAGRFVIQGLPRRKLEAVAVGDTGASATVPIDASVGDVGAVELVVDVTGTIAGVVVDAEGEPLEGVQVSAGPDFRGGGGGADMSSWRLRGFPEDLSDAAGAFTLTGLAPGTYQVRASRSQRGRNRRGFLGETVTAKAGDSAVRIVLPVDGAVKGAVAFEDGAAPTTFNVSINFMQEPFASADGGFQIDELPPGDYDLKISGNGFEPKSVKAKVASGEVADVGTITVRKGRTIRGIVVVGGQPVAGASVYIGSQIFGTGSSNQASFGGGPPGSQNTKTTVTDDAGGFEVSGFGRRDLTIVAEHEEHGRSRAVRLPTGDPGEQSLTIALEPFGTMTGTVRDAGEIVEGVIVSVQSATAPGAMYGVASGADGTFRLDRLAPDSYKVSAMVGMNPMTGMGWFSKTVAVTGGKETKVDVAIVKGTIVLTAIAKTPTGTPVSGMGWIASGAVMARTGRELQLRLAAQGDGTSNFVVMIAGRPASFKQLTAGDYTVCLLPLPSELRGPEAMGYAMEHGDDLPAFCKAVKVAAAPDAQELTVDVEIPTLITEEAP